MGCSTTPLISLLCGKEQTKRRTGATVKEAARLRERLHHFLWANHPAASESRQTPVLGQAVDQDDGIMVDVLNVFSGRARFAILVILIPAVELVEYLRET